jgi:hypothetical protein
MPITKIFLSKQIEAAAVGGSAFITDSGGIPRYLSPGATYTILTSQGVNSTPIFDFPHLTWERTLLETSIGNGSLLTQSHTIDNTTTGNLLIFNQSNTSSITFRGSANNTVQIGENAVASNARSIVIGDGAGLGTYGEDSVLIGNNSVGAGSSGTGGCIVIGSDAAFGATLQSSIVLGYRAAESANLTTSISIGESAGRAANSTDTSIMIGKAAGSGATFTGPSVIIGAEAGFSASAETPTFIGFEAGNLSNTTGSSIFIGQSAGSSATGLEMIGIGRSTNSTLRGNYIISIGTRAGGLTFASGQNDENVYIGYEAFYNPTIATNNTNNVILGNGAGRTSVNTVTSTVLIGKIAGENGSGSNKVAIGNSAARGNTSNDIIAIGSDALNASTGNTGSVAIGRNSGNTSNGIGCVYIGNSAGQNSTNGANVYIGDTSGNSATGARNVAIGELSADASTGSNCVLIGRQAGSASTANNCIFIGTAVGIGNATANRIIISSDSGNGTLSYNGTSSWGIGTANPNASVNLEISGTSGVFLPFGTTAQRPVLQGSRIRSNIDSNIGGIECGKSFLMSGPFAFGNTSATSTIAWVPVLNAYTTKLLVDTTVTTLTNFTTTGLSINVPAAGMYKFWGSAYYFGQTVANTPIGTVGARWGFNFSGTLGVGNISYRMTWPNGSTTLIADLSSTNYGITGLIGASVQSTNSLAAVNVMEFQGVINATTAGNITLLCAPENVAGNQVLIRMGSNIHLMQL